MAREHSFFREKLKKNNGVEGEFGEMLFFFNFCRVYVKIKSNDWFGKTFKSARF